MAKFFKEPLIQFLIGGFLLFIALAFFAPTAPNEDRYRIDITDDTLMLYMQYQDKAFDAENAQQALASLDAAARRRLEEDYIRDEILVREAVALGLDKNDDVIRKRLIQKMDFILQGFMGGADSAFTEDEITAHFRANSEQYKLDAEASFTHVFFSKEKRGPQAEADAKATLKDLNKNAVPFEKSGAYGDRFYFLRNYIKRPKRLITDHFGSEMTDQIFQSRPSPRWIGPFSSKYGSHLILLRSLEAARVPSLAEARTRILEDMHRERREKIHAAAISKLSEKYTLERTSGAN